LAAIAIFDFIEFSIGESPRSYHRFET